VGNSKAKSGSKGVGVSQAVRDVLVASINKGQFPLAVVGGLIALLIFKMPPSDVSKLVFDMLDMLHRGELVGYILSFFGFGGWYTHAKWQRKMMADEVLRMSEARTAAQGLSVGKALLKSSEASK
jgi:hypothetical protein